MATNPNQVDNLIKYIKTNHITQAFTAANKAAGVMNFFTQADTPNPNSPPPTFPCLGITDHGPAFSGVNAVTKFFTQLFTTFPDMLWEVPPPGIPSATKLVSGDTNQIGIQMTVTGTYQAQWFPSGPYYSLPLSQLPANATGASLGSRKGDHNGLPAFAIFIFDGTANCLINQLQIYIDRYALMQSTALAWTPDGTQAQLVGENINVSDGGRGRSITIRIED